MMLGLAQFNVVVENAFEEKAPHKICAYVYELANGFNRFYHETKILSEKEAEKKSSWIALLLLTRDGGHRVLTPQSGCKEKGMSSNFQEIPHHPLPFPER